MNDTLKTILLTAVENAREGITISDARLPDNPLIYVNKGFLQMTGYAAEEVLHKNCRFLQSNKKAQPAIGQIRHAVRNGKPVQVELVNFRKGGTPFCNRLSITPVFDRQGTLTHFIGIQEDITSLKENEELASRIARQQLINQTTVKAQEQERETIGKELHDNINQLLASARLFLNIQDDGVASQRELMKKSSQIINEAIEQVRQLSHRLVQPQFEKHSLQESLQQMVTRLQSAVSFQISLSAQLNETRLNAEKKLLFYRVAQEQLNNIIKYANAGRVAIVLQEDEKAASLLIKDDGIGFDKANTPQGIGLRNISNRVEIEAGSVWLDTAPGKGCSLKIAVPL